MADANTRPVFHAPWKGGVGGVLKSYVGHNPDHAKMDCYVDGWVDNSAILAAAPGKVTQHFDPGGIEIRHYIPGTTTLGNWFTTYMHMTQRAAVGASVGYGSWVGQAGSVGTGVKHLHHEQLWDPSGDGDADNENIVLPALAEYNGGKPFSMPLGEPGIRIVSANGMKTPAAPAPVPAPAPQPAPHTAAARPWWPLPPGHYLGLASGPNESHSGAPQYDQLERGLNINGDAVRTAIRYVQNRMIDLGYAGTTDRRWADGVFEQPTKDAVARWQRAKYAAQTSRFGEVWSDDYGRL